MEYARRIENELRENESVLEPIGPGSEEVFAENVVVQIPGHDPIVVEAGLPIIKTPVKSSTRSDKPNKH